jgi:hypothetical protein
MDISKVALGFQNFGYEFLMVGGDVWRWLCSHMPGKCCLMLMGGRAKGFACADLGARTPISVSGNLVPIIGRQFAMWYKYVGWLLFLLSVDSLLWHNGMWDGYWSF